MSADEDQARAFFLRALAAQRAANALGADQPAAPKPCTQEHAIACLATARSQIDAAHTLACYVAESGPVDVRFEAGQLAAGLTSAISLANEALLQLKPDD